MIDLKTYRCFIYKGQHSGEKSMTYNIAQSGDATCNGLSSPTDGSRTMKLTNSTYIFVATILLIVILLTLPSVIVRSFRRASTRAPIRAFSDFHSM